MKNCNEALKVYDQLLTSVNTGGKSKILQRKSNAYNSMGMIYFLKGNYPEALKILFAALAIREETGDKKGVSYTENNIGLIYYRQHNYPEALKYFFASLKIRKELEENLAHQVRTAISVFVLWNKGTIPKH